MDLWNAWVLSLAKKAEGAIDGHSENRDCDEVMYAREVNQVESKQDEVDGTKKEGDYFICFVRLFVYLVDSRR